MYAVYGYNTCKIMKYHEGLKWMGQEPYALLEEDAMKIAKSRLKRYNEAGVRITAEKLITPLRFEGVEGIKIYH